MDILHPKEMISESLYDQLGDIEKIRTKFLLCSIDFVVQDKVEKVTGVLSSILSTREKDLQVDIKVSLYDALGILESWKELPVKSLFLEFDQFILHYDGLFRILSVKISPTDIENSICILHLSLEKE